MSVAETYVGVYVSEDTKTGKDSESVWRISQRVYFSAMIFNTTAAAW